jgi:hypothetical protein
MATEEAERLAQRANELREPRSARDFSRQVSIALPDHEPWPDARGMWQSRSPDALKHFTGRAIAPSLPTLL